LRPAPATGPEARAINTITLTPFLPGKQNGRSNWSATLTYQALYRSYDTIATTTMAQTNNSAEGLGDASLQDSAVGALDGVECAMASEDSVDTLGRCQPTLLGESMKHASPEDSAVGALNQVGHAMASEDSLDIYGRSQPTLLGIPQELRDKIVRACGVAEEH
jgi:hypothetical protein